MNKLEEYREYKKNRPNYWICKVTSPQGGLSRLHEFEGPAINKILEIIIDGLDLTEADSVDIKFIRAEP